MTDYFTLFGLPISLPVDGSLLISGYQALQRQYHPDRFASASDRDRLLAAQKAAEINTAYQTLKNPLTSAEYLLSLHGIDVLSEQKSIHDTEFLIQQLTLREELDEIEKRRSQERLLAFSTRIHSMINAQRQQLLALIEQQEWEKAGDSARKLRFLDKLQQQIEQTEERLYSL